MMGDENKIRDAADAIKGIAEAVPVYEDALQPAAKEIGVALQTVAKSIQVALAPLTALIWGYDQIKDYVNTALTKRLKKVPEEQIVSPRPEVAGPVLEALRFAGHDPDLRELFANLLATSMDATTARNAHPAFTDIIRHMTPDEARMLRQLALGDAYPMLSLGELRGGQLFPTGGGKFNPFSVMFFMHFSLLPYDSGCSYPEMFLSYLDNLRRLGLIEIRDDYTLSGEGVYEPLEAHPKIREAISARGKVSTGTRREGLFLTTLGRQFCDACVIEHGE